MNKNVLCVAVCGAAVFAMAQMPPMPVVERRDPMEMNKNPKFVKATGGMIEISQPGKCFLFADARKEKSDLTPALGKMREACRMTFVVREEKVEGCAYKAGVNLLKGDDVGAVAIIRDGAEDEPVLSAYPENKICVLNVTPLKAGASDSVYRDRLEKELWRAMCFAAGGASSGIDQCVMNTVLAPADLDTIPCLMAGPVAVAGINRTAKRYGFGRHYVMPYRSACLKGIAPKPANEAQEAVWNQVMKQKKEATKEPSAPIKIKFDPKQGR